MSSMASTLEKGGEAVTPRSSSNARADGQRRGRGRMRSYYPRRRDAGVCCGFALMFD